MQPELIFVNGMVHLPQERNFGTPTTLPSPATPPHLSQRLFLLRNVTRSIYLRIKSLVGVLSTLCAPDFNTCVKCEYKQPLLFTIDKLMSGSFLEGKAFIKKPQNFEL